MKDKDTSPSGAVACAAEIRQNVKLRFEIQMACAHMVLANTAPDETGSAGPVEDGDEHRDELFAD